MRKGGIIGRRRLVILPTHLFNLYFVTCYVLVAVLDAGVIRHMHISPLQDGQGCTRNHQNQRLTLSVLSVLNVCFSLCDILLLLYCCPAFLTWERSCCWQLLSFTSYTVRYWKVIVSFSTSVIKISGDFLGLVLIRCPLSVHSTEAGDGIVFY